MSGKLSLKTPSGGSVILEAVDTATDKVLTLPASDAGLVAGPASATAGALAAFDGTSGKIVKQSAGYAYAGTVYFTSSGSFLKADPLGTGDIGLRAIRVRVQGAGGGAGGAVATGASQGSLGMGGGGGGYSESFITNVAGLASTVSVGVGSSGAGGAAGASGSAGGSSSFGTLVTAFGGSGGAASGAFPVGTLAVRTLGVAAGVGDLAFGGSAPPMYSIMLPGVGRPQGGPSRFGFTTTDSDGTASGLNGLNATIVGVGGSGGANGENQSAKTGGAGAPGIVIVDCFV